MIKLRNTYYLLRHGQSIKNIKHIVVCWPETVHCPLTKKGINDAKKVAKKIKKKNIGLIFCSDLLRTAQTAEIVGKEIGINPQRDKRLREVNAGILNGMSISEVGKFWNQGKRLTLLEHFSMRYKLAPPKGETYIEIEKRMENFIKEKERKYKGKNILIVSHERPITILRKVICKQSLEELVNIIKNKKIIKTGEVKKLKC